MTTTTHWAAQATIHNCAQGERIRERTSRDGVVLLLDGRLEMLSLDGEIEARFAAAEVIYRLAPKDKYPAQIEDCKAAVRWLRANAGKYQVKADRIGAIGFSAGGHLVAAALASCMVTTMAIVGRYGVTAAVRHP